MDSSLLAGWENFYVIIGSTSGGLIGLTFVVIALVSDARRVRPAGLHVFVTPTIVHFGCVLALSAFLAMPHLHVWTVSATFALVGAVGLAYVIWIGSHIPTLRSDYEPVAEDWIFNAILPGVVHGGLLLLAVGIWYRPLTSLYLVAVLALLLLFTGIHNAWDIAVWMTLQRQGGKSDKSE
ncbi:MAG TPA: hypothetical protein VK695_10975 [Steroidobacteraceae bacterium]|jgi:hypothetical protein|nr:hypothetical protein [Steroidobacteraceae bacterium]